MQTNLNSDPRVRHHIQVQPGVSLSGHAQLRVQRLEEETAGSASAGLARPPRRSRQRRGALT